MKGKTDYLELMEREMVVAVGCTEPIAVAYAAALARNEIKDFPIEKIDVITSGNIIKNAMAVTIPGTKEQGVKMAAALGAVAGDPLKGLAVLEKVTEKEIAFAKQLCEGQVSLTTSEELPLLYVDITVYGGGHSGRAVLKNHHDSLVLLERDGKTILNRQEQGETAEVNISTDDVEDILDFVNTVDIDKLNIVKRSIELNSAISLEGLKNNYGLAVGRTVMGKDPDAAGLMTYAVGLTSAGSDARMAGAPLPVMSNSGSGNQGICAIMPVVACAEKLGVSAETLIRGGALSNLITIHVKKSFGRLSPLCGAVAAGIGASAGIVYVMGGGLEQIKAAIQNMFGNVTGMICDGAKAGCAMKVATCVFAALQSAFIALRGREVQPTEGIIEYNVEDTIGNISRLSAEGMPTMDPLLLNIMINKRVGKED